MFQVLLEFDGLSWDKREWYRISDVFLVFIVEESLAWVSRKDPYNSDSGRTIPWPCLVSR